MSATVNVEVGESDLIEGYRLVSKWPRKQWIAFGTHTVILSVIGAALISSSTVALRPIGRIIFIVLALGWFIQWLVHLLMNSALCRRRFKRRLGLSVFSWDDNGIAVENQIARTHLPWSQIQKWRQSNNVLVVCSSSRYIVIPKRNNPRTTELVNLLGIKLGANKAL